MDGTALLVSDQALFFPHIFSDEKLAEFVGNFISKQLATGAVQEPAGFTDEFVFPVSGHPFSPWESTTSNPSCSVSTIVFQYLATSIGSYPKMVNCKPTGLTLVNIMSVNRECKLLNGICI